MEQVGGQHPKTSQSDAQQSADRIRLLRKELATPELQQVLDLSPEQQRRFEDWVAARLAELSQQFDVDVSISQKRVSGGMRIASTLGGIAICLAVVLFFRRYWGNLGTALQVAIVSLAPLVALGGAEFVAARERKRYFTSLLALLAFGLFVMNLVVFGIIFNVNSTERVLLAWGAFATVLAYRYGLRLLLVAGLLLLISYGAAMITAQLGYRWLNFGERPELVAFLSLLVFAVPVGIRQKSRPDFAAVYRFVGAIVFFICLLSLAVWGIPSYLPLDRRNVERLYEFVGLLMSSGAIWLGITRTWNGVVNISATAFVIFLLTRLSRWWWDWMPKYLFFAAIGAIAIALMLMFKRLRGQMAQKRVLA